MKHWSNKIKHWKIEHLLIKEILQKFKCQDYHWRVIVKIIIQYLLHVNQLNKLKKVLVVIQIMNLKLENPHRIEINIVIQHFQNL